MDLNFLPKVLRFLRKFFKSFAIGTNSLRKKLFPIAKDLTSIAKEMKNLPKDLIPTAKNT